MSKELLASKVVFNRRETGVPSSTAKVGMSGIIGTAQKGEINKAVLVTSWADFVKKFGYADSSSSLYLYAKQYFDEGGQYLYVVRVAHYLDIANAGTLTALKASGQIDTVTAVPQPARVVSTNTAPFNLEDMDSIVISVDGGALQGATFAGQSASLSSATEPYNLVGGETLDVIINGGSTQTIVINAGDITPGNATAQEVANTINAQLTDGYAYATSLGVVELVTDRKGSSATIEVTGGTANAELQYPSGQAIGTGNVADLSGVTGAEVKTILEGSISGINVSYDTSGYITIETTATGSTHSLQVDSSSTADSKMGFDNNLHNGSDVGSTGVLQANGKYYGAYGNNVTIEIANSSSGDSSLFNLNVLFNGIVEERYPDVSIDISNADYVVSKVNNASEYIELVDLGVNTRPTNGSYTMTGGDNGLTGINDNDYIGDQSAQTGLFAFDPALDLNLLCTAGIETPNVQIALLNYCEINRDKLTYPILSIPQGYSISQARDYQTTTANLYNRTDNGSIYYPWVKVKNPNKNAYGNEDYAEISVSSVAMGIYARQFSELGGVYQSPAGLIYGRSKTIIGLEGEEPHDILQENNRDVLYPVRINPLNKGDGGYYLDGSRTLADNTKYRSINTQIGVSHIIRDLQARLNYLRHIRTYKKARAEAYRICYNYLLAQMRLGAFRDMQIPENSFSVDVSEGINPPSMEEQGIMNINLRLNSVGSYDWIVVNIEQGFTV